MTRYVFVDVEAAGGPSPHSGVVTEFGAVDFATRQTFHGILRSAHLDPPDSGRYVLDDEFPPADAGPSRRARPAAPAAREGHAT